MKEGVALSKSQTDGWHGGAGLAVVYRVVFCLVGWFGVMGHIVRSMISSSAEWLTPLDAMWTLLGTLRFYTIQSNIFVLVWWVVAIWAWKRRRSHPLLAPRIRGAFTLYISATFIIFALFLEQLYNPDGIDIYLSIVSHYITPLAFILDWLFTEERGAYHWRYAVQWLVYPVAYLFFSQIHGLLTGFYLYPFLNQPVLGWGGLAAWVAGLSAFFVGLGTLFVAINRWVSRPCSLNTHRGRAVH